MVLPRPRRGAHDPFAAEITYIIDTSGSMEGVSIAQAREALDMALDRLLPGDRFNVIEFNSYSTPLFSAPMPVDPATLARAKQFVGALRARGGTEMLPALKIALAGERESSLVRQSSFSPTVPWQRGRNPAPGSRQLGDRRLFTIGIGPSPNTSSSPRRRNSDMARSLSSATCARCGKRCLRCFASSKIPH